MLREAARSWKSYREAMEEVCQERRGTAVRPVMLVQVEDAIRQADLKD